MTEISTITGVSTYVILRDYKKDIAKKIKELLILDKKTTEIANLLSLHRQTITNLIRSNNLEKYWKNRRDIGGSTLNKDKFYREFMKGTGLVQLSKNFKFSHRKAKKLLQETGFKVFHATTIRKLHEALEGKSYIPVKSYLQEVINGTLLGDGYIEPIYGKEPPTNPSTMSELQSALSYIKKFQTSADSMTGIDWTNESSKYNAALDIVENHPTGRFSLNKSIVETDWVHHIEKILKNNNHQTNITKKYNAIFDKHMIELRDHSTHQLYEERKRWYPNGIKILPEDLKLSPNTVLHWYIGDGTYNKNTDLTLCTDNFTKKEVQALAKLLENETGITKTSIVPHLDPKYPESKNWRIGIYRKDNIEKFFSYISKSNQDSLAVAKQTVPWKFDPNLKKEDVIDDEKLEDLIKNHHNYFKRKKMN